LSDEETASLPTRLDAETFGRMEISTWRTDAGDLDVLSDIPSRDGRRRRYVDLVGQAHSRRVHGVTVQVVALSDLIASKEWANRRRTPKHSRSCMSSPPRGTDSAKLLQLRTR